LQGLSNVGQDGGELGRHGVGTTPKNQVAFGHSLYGRQAEGPDGTVSQALLHDRTLFAFRHMVTVKKWKQTTQMPPSTHLHTGTAKPPPPTLTLGLTAPQDESQHAHNDTHVVDRLQGHQAGPST